MQKKKKKKKKKKKTTTNQLKYFDKSIVVVIDNGIDICDKDLLQVNATIITCGPIFLTLAASFLSSFDRKFSSTALFIKAGATLSFIILSFFS